MTKPFSKDKKDKEKVLLLPRKRYRGISHIRQEKVGHNIWEYGTFLGFQNFSTSKRLSPCSSMTCRFPNAHNFVIRKSDERPQTYTDNERTGDVKG